MPVKLHFEFEERPEERREPDAIDPWPVEADVVAEDCQDRLERLRRAARTDQAVGVFIVLASFVIIVLDSAVATAVALLLFALTVAAFYVPLRSRPRQNAIAELRARLEVLDPKCESCGYALRHLRTERCPECGRRVQLPARAQVGRVLSDDEIMPARASITSELGWIVLLIMCLTGLIVGRLLGARVGLALAGLPPAIFLIDHARRRKAALAPLPTFAVCDYCGKPTPLEANNCPQCKRGVLAEHVYVRPGLLGEFDRRLHVRWAQISGGAIVCALPFILAFMNLDWPSAWVSDLIGPVSCILAIAALILLWMDLRRRTRGRIDRFDASAHPLCPVCQVSLRGQPANGRCPRCEEAYTGRTLAGVPG